MPTRTVYTPKESVICSMWKIIVAIVVLVTLAKNAVTASPKLPIPIEGRIVGGEDTLVLKHPHQVSVRYKSCTTCAFIHECGGSIYNEDSIITAAHCVYQREQSAFAVVVGSTRRDGTNGVIALVRKIVIHEQYNAALTDNDVALLFLATPVQFNELTIAPIALATQTPEPNTAAVITGWGATSEGGVYAVNLQEATTSIISKEACVDAYDSERVTESMLCARLIFDKRDACKGDSGGPLVVEEKLAGIVSWGIGCGRPQMPGVYVDVAYMREWLEQTIAENSQVVA